MNRGDGRHDVERRAATADAWPSRNSWFGGTTISLGDDFYFANALTILSFVDLDRNGNVEVIVDTGGFESTTVSVIEPVTGDTLLRRRCGP